MYRTVDSAFWTDPKVRKLDARARLAFLYLITNPHTHVGGIYYLPTTLALLETGLTEKEWDKVSDTLSRLGLARFDPGSDVVWVVNMLAYQGRGEKNERAAAAHLATLHNSKLIQEFTERYPRVKQYVKHTPSDTLSAQYPAISLIRTPDQEQEQDKEQEQNTPPSPPPGGVMPPIPEPLDTPAFREAWADWIQHRKERKPKLTPTAAKGALAELAAIGPDRAVAAIRRSIAKGWQGIFESRQPANGQHPTSASFVDKIQQHMEGHRP